MDPGFLYKISNSNTRHYENLAHQCKEKIIPVYRPTKKKSIIPQITKTLKRNRELSKEISKKIKFNHLSPNGNERTLRGQVSKESFSSDGARSYFQKRCVAELYGIKPKDLIDISLKFNFI